MRNRRIVLGRLLGARLAVLAAVGLSSLATIGSSGQAFAAQPAGGAVLQTNLVSDLPGVAAVNDPNLVNPWGMSESSGSPMWVSDNNAGVATLYRIGGATPVTVLGLVVNIPTPVSQSGGTPTGTVFNFANASGAFAVSGRSQAGADVSAPALFLFATEDGTIAGWNPTVNPQGFTGTPGTSAVIAVDNSGNNFTNPDPSQQTGAVYKGLTFATSATPIIAGDADSTALLYASDFRDARVDVFDSKFKPVTSLPAGAFTDAALPGDYSPFNVQVLLGKVYVTFARQDKLRHDDLAGPHRGFVDVFNLDGTPGLAGGQTRLITRGDLDSPWGLAIAPAGFAGLAAAGSDPVLLVGNFGDGHINAFDASTGASVGALTDPDGEPIQIDGLWALKVGNGGNGGAADTVYFTAGIFGESHGLFGSLAGAAPGSAEGPAEAQWVQANVDLVQLDQAQLAADIASGAPEQTIDQDQQKLDRDSKALERVQDAFAGDTSGDVASG